MLKNHLHVYGTDDVCVPAHGNFALELYQNMCKRKEQMALIDADTGESISYGELAQQTVDIALSLVRMGIGKGHLVGVCSEKRIEVMAVMAGIICTGASFTALDITCGKATMLHRINLSRPKVVFLSPSGYDAHYEIFKSVDCIESYIVFGDEKKIGAALLKDFVTEHGPLEDFRPADVGMLDDMNIIYSSGTTGLPKGVPMSHLNLLLLTRKVATPSIYDGQVFLNTREWYYTYGLMHTQIALCAGATVVFSPKNEIEDLLKAIEKYKVKLVQVCPSTTNEFAKSTILENYDVSSVNLMISGGTTCDTATERAVKQRFPNLAVVHEMYGMSEAGLICDDMLLSETKPGSVGRVDAGVIVKVVDINTRKALGPNQQGEICIKSLTLMRGYLGDVSINPYDEEGFYKTGDVGYYDEDKYFFVIDRIKEMIKYYDVSVAPAEFEAILVQHPAVLEAGVVGAPHARCGEAATAFVALQPAATPPTEEELVEYVDAQMSSKTKLVGGIRFVDKLPRVNAKLDRKALKQML